MRRDPSGSEWSDAPGRSESSGAPGGSSWWRLALAVAGLIGGALVPPLLAEEAVGLLGAPAVQKLMARSRNQGPVPVIVRLAIDAGAPERLAGTVEAERTGRRQSLAAVRAGVLASLGDPNLGDPEQGGVKPYRSLPLIGLEVGPAALERLARHPAVVAIHPDALLAPQLVRSIPLIGADAAWAAGHGGAGHAVAILDTGVDGEHPFLAGKIVAEACYSTNGGGATSLCPGGVSESVTAGSGANCPLSTDGCEHGTHVAGIAAGRGDGFSGVARDASVVAIQVFSQFDDAATCGARRPCALAFTSDLIKALERVAEIDDLGIADVAAANLSLGGGQFASACDDDPIKLAIDALRARGIATVVASGNDGFDGLINAPACVSTAIAVGATDASDRVAGFSNHAPMVDLMAPGVAINSALAGGGFTRFSGTSMATPHVAGAFALLASAEPEATVAEIEAALLATGRMVARAGVSEARIQVDAALERLLGSKGQGPLNDKLANSVDLEGAVVAVGGSNVGATAQPREPVHAGVGGGRSVWWRWRAPRDGLARITTFGADFDTVLAVYRGGRISWLRELASNDDALGGEVSLQSAVEIEAKAGKFYRIAVDGYQGAVGEIVLEIRQDGAGNDRFADATRLEGEVAMSSHSNVGAGAEAGEPVHAGVGGGRSLWWRWTAPADRAMIVTTLGSAFDSVLTVYTGDAVDRLTEIASNDDQAGLGQQSLVRFEATAGTTYRIAVDGLAGAAGATAAGEVALLVLPARAGLAGVIDGLDLHRLAVATRRAAAGR